MGVVEYKADRKNKLKAKNQRIEMRLTYKQRLLLEHKKLLYDCKTLTELILFLCKLDNADDMTIEEIKKTSM